MASILVHITHGPEHPSRAALVFHVAKAALDQGYSVTLFLAGDGVQLMRDGVLDHLTGLGTGTLRQLYDAVVSAGTKIYLSGMSSKTRGLSEAELAGKPYEFGGPADLVRLAVEHDRMFTYKDSCRALIERAGARSINALWFLARGMGKPACSCRR
jgi:predicted peroxiredoxin